LHHIFYIFVYLFNVQIGAIVISIDIIIFRISMYILFDRLRIINIIIFRISMYILFDRLRIINIIIFRK
jgi:hypothetical protein